MRRNFVGMSHPAKDRSGREGGRGGDEISVCQIKEMRQNIALGCGQKRGWRVAIDGAGKGGGIGGGWRQGGKNLGLSGFAVPVQILQAGQRGLDGRAMAGKHLPPVARHKAAQRGHVGPHVPVRRRDQRTGPAHRQIAGEQQPFGGKAQMVGAVAGGVQDLDPQAAKVQVLAIGQVLVGGETVVKPLASAGQSLGLQARHQGGLTGPDRAKGQHRRAGGL